MPILSPRINATKLARRNRIRPGLLNHQKPNAPPPVRAGRAAVAVISPALRSSSVRWRGSWRSAGLRPLTDDAGDRSRRRRRAVHG